MNSRTKCVVSIVVAVMLCFMFFISVAAIDTPWLPLKPDGEEPTAEGTDALEPDGEEPTAEVKDALEPDGEEPTAEVTEALESDGETEAVPSAPTEPDQKETDTTDARDTTETSVEDPIPQKGCSSNYTPGLALVILPAALTLLLRRRGEAGKHERRLHER